jgi:hypothetical protein
MRVSGSGAIAECNWESSGMARLHWGAGPCSSRLVRHPGQLRRAAALALPGSHGPAKSPLAPVHRRVTHTLHLFPGSKQVIYDGCGRIARQNGRCCQLAASGLGARGAAWVAH